MLAHVAKSSRWILVVALAQLGCEPQEPIGSPPGSVKAPAIRELSDQSIAQAVVARLSEDPGVDASRISVSVKDGIVELTGEARTLLTKGRVVRVTQSVKGVRSVDDRVILRLARRPDEDLARDVNRALLQSGETDSLGITTQVERGVVTLTGRVQSFQQREIAGRIAEGVRGVREVQNDVAFDSGAKRTDAEIWADVRSRLRWDVLVNDGLILVAVRDGKVALTGSIGSAAERGRAFRDAWVAGVRQVDSSGLEVTWWAKRHDLYRNKLLDKSDPEIQRAVLAALANDSRVPLSTLSVQISQGVATLSGAVSSLSAKLAAEELARNTVGVLLVRNELDVRPAKLATDQILSERARAALLWDAELDAQPIDVSAHDGVVTLTGSVTTVYDRQRALDIVASVSGIRALNNQLHVSHGESRYVYDAYSDPYAPCCAESQAAPLSTAHTDAEITATIREQLRWSPFLDGSTIVVSVTGGRAILTGEVATPRERSVATEDALRGGALEVDNRLHVVASSAAL